MTDIASLVGQKSVLGFIIGLVTIVLTLSISFWLAFIGFVMMLAAALLFEQNLRRLGRAGMNQLSMNVRSGNLKNSIADKRGKMRDKFRPDDPIQ